MKIRVPYSPTEDYSRVSLELVGDANTPPVFGTTTTAKFPVVLAVRTLGDMSHEVTEAKAREQVALDANAALHREIERLRRELRFLRWSQGDWQEYPRIDPDDLGKN